MATKRKSAPKASAKSTKKPADKVASVKAAAPKVVEKDTKVNASACKCGVLRGFFARKYEERESILTIFKSPKIYGALIGELVGVLLLTLFLLSFGVLEPLGVNLSFQLNMQILFVVIGVTIAVAAISGAHLNPIITAGMMATRRVSVIRGVLYIVAQIVGAWLGLLILSGFKAGGGDAVGTAGVNLPTITAVTAETNFWLLAVLGLISAIVLGFFFARALRYRKSVFTFAATVGTGVLVALLIVFAIQTSFFDYPTNYALANNPFTLNNPALSLMYQGFIPTTGADFGAVAGQLGLNLAAFIGIPAVGSVVGFYLSDISGRLASGGCDCDCGKSCAC
jgi:glycerol uptake facilitator-like aquaporin